VFNATFSNISTLMATSFSGGRGRGTWREQPTMGKQLVSFITCGCVSRNIAESGVKHQAIKLIKAIHSS
jgi:hypothetical protein